MTRRDYVLIASVLSEAKRDARSFPYDAHTTLSILTDRFADALADENPRFNATRFRRAAHNEEAS